MRRRPSIQGAFDEARFGPTRTLNLRDGLPSGAAAVRRAEGWLRAKQIEAAGDVLIITGRGQGSLDGVPVIRTEVQNLLNRLGRSGVVAKISEHSPGSVVVTLAPLRALFEVATRKKDSGKTRTIRTAPAFNALEPATLEVLHRLAERAIESLGVRAPSEQVIVEEMERQFSLITRTIPQSEFSESAFAAALV
ncbi:MAG: hypothetical protein ABI877_15610, partial [Gemmatimonadaceae bacterium]